MYTLYKTSIPAYAAHLRELERSPATVEKYIHALRQFYLWLEGRGVDKGRVIDYKAYLKERYAASTVNGELAALNGFFRFQKWEDCTVKLLRIQRRIFCPEHRELSREEYETLVQTAEREGKRRLSLLLQLMASTGIRVSEIAYVTAQTVAAGQVEIQLKGKIRVILLPKKLCRKLKGYLRAERIDSGPVFRGKDGRSMGRKVIWAQMKRLCHRAGVPPEKVFPHNLRHLFARSFYRAQKDIAKLADLLGHSSVQTTRIYLVSSGAEHRRLLERLQLVC